MLTLEHVRALEARVEKAVNLIAALRLENSSLRAGLSHAEGRVAELESLVRDFQKDQSRIEEGIVEALRKLDAFEDMVHSGPQASEPEPVLAAPAPVVEPAEEPAPAEAAATEEPVEMPASETEPAPSGQAQDDDDFSLEPEEGKGPETDLDIF